MKSSLFLCLVVAIFALSAITNGNDNRPSSARANSGKCGENVEWNLYDNGTLIISGNSAMSVCDISKTQVNSVISVVIEQGITSIPSEAFQTWKMRSVFIPNTVSSVGTSAFQSCENLTSIELGSSIKSIPSFLFSGCFDLASVSMSDSVVSIGDMAFFDCFKLVDFPLPKSVRSIGQFAFNSCTSFNSLTIPVNLSTIKPNAFSGCPSLPRIDVEPGNEYFESIDGVLFNKGASSLWQYPGARVGGYTVPSSVATIKSGAFGGCFNLTSVSIPDSVTSMEEYTFSACLGLKSISFFGTSDPGPSNKQSFTRCDVLESILVPWNYTNSSFCGADEPLIKRCWVVKSEGYLQQKWLAVNGSLLSGSNEDLLYFFDSDEYIIGDADSHDVLSVNSRAEKDMVVVILKKNTVVVELEIPQNEINRTDIAIKVSDLCGIDAERILVDVILDDKGEVIRVEVFVNDKDDSIRIVEAVNNIDKTKSCKYGVLCRTKRVYCIDCKDESSMVLPSMDVENSVRQLLTSAVFITLLFLTVLTFF